MFKKSANGAEIILALGAEKAIAGPEYFFLELQKSICSSNY